MEEDFQETVIEVGAYSGYRANERPLYLVLAGRMVKVRDILDRWYGQDHDYYKILGDDGRVYLLKWHRFQDVWSLEKALEGS